MIRPLNPTLYHNLERIFGKVKISNEGQAMMGRYVNNIVTEDQSFHLDTAGEYYLVCCDKCNDTRFRLTINHRWGVQDEQGRRKLWLAICYNENCYRSHEQREELYARVSNASSMSLAKARILPGEVVTAARIVEPPGPIKRLDELPAEHPANVYLAGRGYNPERLGRFYGVGWCSNSFYYLARNRIYIPITQGKELKGWQMRYIGDIDWKKEDIPKYFSCPAMMRGKVLYNLDNAARYKTGVGMEGPSDTWSLGPMGMSSLGFPMTQWQRRMIIPNFREHTFVALFDPDVLERESTLKQYNTFLLEMQGKFEGGFAEVRLPAGSDPGQWERGLLRRYIEKEALGQGVKISWARR